MHVNITNIDHTIRPTKQPINKRTYVVRTTLISLIMF